MDQKRRFILKSLGLGSGLMLLKPWRIPSLLAESDKKKNPDRYFIFCYFNGGWDLLLSLDPRDPTFFSEKKFQSKATKIQLAWGELPERFRKDGSRISKEVKQAKDSHIAFGPAAHVLLKHTDVMCVVRGISMDTVTHAVGRRYFITGLMPAGLNARGSSIPTAIAAQQGDLTSIPNLVVRVETYNRDQPNYASGLQVTNVYDLLNTLRAGPQSPRGELRKLLEEYRSNRENCDPVNLDQHGLLSLIKASQKKAKLLIDSNLSRHFDFFNSKDKEMLDIKKRYNIKSLSSPEAQAALAYQAVKYNVAQCVSIELTNRLDTHGAEWATQQIEQLYIGFKALSQLIDDLKTTPYRDKTLLDYTTVVVFSEFGRQPFLNNRGGRDHWIASSALLFGAGVPHNKIVGQTTPNEMGPVEIDPYTGKPVSANGVTLTPTLVLASVMESAGLDTAHLRTNGLPCLMKK